MVGRTGTGGGAIGEPRLEAGELLSDVADAAGRGVVAGREGVAAEPLQAGLGLGEDPPYVGRHVHGR